MRASLRPTLLAAAFLATFAFTRAIVPVSPLTSAAVDAIPLTLAPWTGRTAPALDPDVMKRLGADEYVRRYYRDAAAAPGTPRVVEVDISYYTQPRVGANVHSPLNCLPGNGWKIASMEPVRLQGGANATIQSLIVQRGKRQFAMAYWFQSGDRIATSELSARFQLLTDALWRRPVDAGLVRVMALVTDQNSAKDNVLAFASRLMPELTKVLKRT